MARRSIGRIVAIAPLMILTLFSAPGGIRVAAADDCPDAEVVFARGTGEPVGPGGAEEADVPQRAGHRATCGIFTTSKRILRPASSKIANQERRM